MQRGGAARRPTRCTDGQERAHRPETARGKAAPVVRGRSSMHSYVFHFHQNLPFPRGKPTTARLVCSSEYFDLLVPMPTGTLPVFAYSFHHNLGVAPARVSELGHRVRIAVVELDEVSIAALLCSLLNMPCFSWIHFGLGFPPQSRLTKFAPTLTAAQILHPYTTAQQTPLP